MQEGKANRGAIVAMSNRDVGGREVRDGEQERPDGGDACRNAPSRKSRA